MQNDINNQLAKADNVRVTEMIEKLNISSEDKKELIKRATSDDLDVRKSFLKKLAASGVAQGDISNFLAELERLNKKGMYATTKLVSKTGSGHIEMQFKGGDTKLIVPVLIIIGIVIIAALAIVFWR